MILVMIDRLTDCSNGKHKFEPYKKGTVKCSVCGKFAKVGYLTFKEKGATNDKID